MQVITWAWGAVIFWLIVAALLLGGCASVPPDIMAAKRTVDSRMAYTYYRSEGVKSVGCVVMRPSYHKPAHLTAQEGNCLDFAYAYKEVLGRGFVMQERRPDGSGHAFLIVDGWRLDVMEVMPVQAYALGCSK